MISAQLSRRERQIMEALYTLGTAGAREIFERIGEPDALESVRVTLIGLEKKKFVRHKLDGRRHIYVPAQPRNKAGANALAKITDTFFGGSAQRALVAFLDLSKSELDKDDLDALEQWVKQQSRTDKPK
jgi:BlaI family transcriptional regulator, penicillinase repressor